MRCPDCPRYDPEGHACRDGKLNPETLADAIEVAQFLGRRAICMMNDHRERVLDTWSGALLEGRPPRFPPTPSGFRLELVD